MPNPFINSVAAAVALRNPRLFAAAQQLAGRLMYNPRPLTNVSSAFGVGNGFPAVNALLGAIDGYNQYTNAAALNLLGGAPLASSLVARGVQPIPTAAYANSSPLSLLHSVTWNLYRPQPTVAPPPGVPYNALGVFDPSRINYANVYNNPYNRS